MSGVYPAALGGSRIAYQALQDVKQVFSQDGSVQCRVLSGHRASFTVTHPPGKREEYAALEAFALSQRGRNESFTWVNPEKATPVGAVSGAPVVFENYAAGVDEIYLDAMPPGVAGAFWAGDVFNLVSYAKVHKVAFTADSEPANKLLLEDGFAILLEDGSNLLLEDANTVKLIFSPPLIAPITKGQVVNYSNVSYTMKFKTDVQEISVSAPSIVRKQVELEEYIA